MDLSTILMVAAQYCEHLPIIGPYVVPAVSAAVTLMGVCSGLAPHLPPPKKTEGWYPWLYRVVNWCGGNYRFAQNAVDPILKGVVKK